MDPLKQVSIDKRLNLSMKYQESIQKAATIDKKNDEIKTARLHSIETKVVTPRICAKIDIDIGEASPRVHKKVAKDIPE